MKLKNGMLALIFSLLIAGQASANSDLEKALLACSKEENSLKRLVCYDDVSKALTKLSASKPKAKQESNKMGTLEVVAETAKDAKFPEREFGLKAKDPSAGVERIYSVIKKTKKDVYDKYTYTLENGMVWRQAEAGRYKLAKGKQVYIERGMLGAFFMSTKDVNKRIKVKRIK